MTMTKKTNTGLLKYCKAQVGLPYWWGCFGQIATPELLISKRRQYPSYYQSQDFASQLGLRVHDCVGLIKGYLWSDTPTSVPLYNASEDRTAAGYYAKAKECGTISTFPGHPGQLVFKGQTQKGIYHIGVYDGDGYVYHAKGHQWGVVKEPFRKTDWRYWAQCVWCEDDTVPKKDISVQNPGKVDTSDFPTIRKGDKGAYVTLAQQALNLREHYGLEADGDFGPLTEMATLHFQRKYGLEIDGIIGRATWSTLFS